ncbi:hypothetical protein QE375_001582 [Microbacterium foliorum]|uniref:Uncharacterized protein n=1 Tax=Microbacterium foliorum TaxID=104336 RepID=A0ABU1HQW4_9MICO|nr:hypothetical protein [Microbacterium foliorum]MDR6142028.1 hypothetical protein [Microbacterium foliorum]
MDKHPVPREKRRVLEAIIRIIDIVAYFIIFVGGCYAMFWTPDSVQRELSGASWLVPMWAAFLLVGGGLGMVGRITRIWVLEPPADVAGIVGGAMYFVVLGGTLFQSLTAGVATMLVLYATIQMFRRYIELQIFGTDPNVHGFTDRIAEALRRRTGNVAPREE